MKKNIYTNTIESIKAPESLINHSISQLKETDTKSVIIIKKQSKRTPLKFASIIAATLVILVAIGTVTFTKQSKVEHPFIITADAEEITPETYIKFGDTVNLGGYADYILHGYLDENRDFIQTDNYVDLMWVMEEFNVGINCEGENIESITYKAINGCLSYKQGYSGLLDVTMLTTEEIEKYNATGSIDNFQWASACTFDYNDQPRATYTEQTGFEILEDAVDGTVPLRIAFCFEFKEGECVLPMGEEYHVNTNPAFQKEFNEHADEFGLEVTANFKDGTSATKTLKFRCENNGNQIYLSTIEDIS